MKPIPDIARGKALRLPRLVPTPAMPRPVGRPRVLLVEDEPTIAVTLADDLVEHGYAVSHTADGSAAIELVQNGGFDAVVTDLRLPGADGLRVLAATRRGCAGAKVLVISAQATAWGDAARAAGADAVLCKPFANESVVAWLQQRVGRGDREGDAASA